MKIQDTIKQYFFNERKKAKWRTKVTNITGAVITCLIIAATSSEGLAQSGSMSLDGDADYASASHSASLDISNTSITLEAWVKHDGNSNTDAFLINKGTDQDGYRLQFLGEGDETYIRFGVGDVNYSGADIISTRGVPANRWTHVSATYDGQFLKIYINGTLDNTTALERNIGSNSNNLNIGSNASLTANFFSGEIDEIRIWNVTRSASEVADTYLEELTGSETGLVSYYQFSGSQTSGSTVSDVSGANDLSLTGDNTSIVAPGAVPISPDVYAQNKNGQVELTWDQRLGPNDENISSSYKVYRSTVSDGSDRTEVATVSGGATEYTDSGLSNGTTYYYEVTTIDGSGNESDYSPVVMATPYQSMGGGSLYLEKNAYGIVSDRPSMDIAGTDLTMHVWIKHDGHSDENAIIAIKGTDADGYALRFEGTGEAPAIAFAVGDVNYSGSTLISNSSIPAHQWTHVAATYDGNDMKIYINGKLDATGQLSRSIGKNDYDLYIGSDVATSNFFYSGQIDELGIWDVALPRQDIEDHFNQEFIGNEDGLKLYYRFDDKGNSFVRSMDTYHTDMEMVNINGSITLSAPGVYPMTPYGYALGGDSSTELTFTDRELVAASQYKLYRSTQSDGSDRTEIATLSQGTNSYTDTDVSNENTYFYEVTAINDNGQESDYSRFDVARASSYEAGNALSLDGDNDYVRFDDRNSLEGYQQLYSNFDYSITIEAWINHDGTGDENAVVVQKGTTADGYLLRLQGSGNSVNAAFAVGDINYSGSTISSSSSIPANQWTHIAGTYDGTNMKIYINGVLDNTETLSRSVGANNNPLLIGAPNALDGNFYSGEVDEIRIWNSARSDAQIADNYYKELAGSHEDLIAYFRFDESAGTTLTYSSARRAMSGALNGDATYVNSNALSSQPIVSNPIQEITLDEDFGTFTVANLDTVFQDDDTPNLSYSIIVPCHIVEAEIQNDSSLVFTSLENIFGTDTLTVEATDGATTARQSFIVNVESVNDVPELAGFENTLQVPIEGEYSADMYARTADVESADSALAFSFDIDTTGIILDFDGQTLTLTPNDGFDGSATLDMEVTDEHGGTTSITVGVDMVTGTNITDEVGVPEEFRLANNYPNPFNPETTIKYALPEEADVRLTVFNALGQKVAELVNSRKAAGNHSAVFDAENLPSGMYIYRLQAGTFEQVQKMMLVK